MAKTVFIEFSAGAVIGGVSWRREACIVRNERRFNQIGVRPVSDQAEDFSGPAARAGTEIAARRVGVRRDSPDDTAGKDQEYKASGNGSAQRKQRHAKNVAVGGTLLSSAGNNRADESGQTGGYANAQNKEEHVKRTSAQILTYEVAYPEQGDGCGNSPIGERCGNHRFEPRDGRLGFAKPAEMTAN